jgi:hypothetical protein
MCFMLYAATTKPLSRRRWEPGSPDLPVEELSEYDAVIKKHFSNPEVQFVGSTSGCGCDFPHVMFQGGAWPYFENPEIREEGAVSDRLNREKLVNLLESTGDSTVELYGVWDGDFAETPKAHENISLEAILQSGFRFKERAFYKIFIASR